MAKPQIFDLIKRIEELESEIENLKLRAITQIVETAGTNLDDYVEDGEYYFSSSCTPIGTPARC